MFLIVRGQHSTVGTPGGGARQICGERSGDGRRHHHNNGSSNGNDDGDAKTADNGSKYDDNVNGAKNGSSSCSINDISNDRYRDDNRDGNDDINGNQYDSGVLI